MDRTDKHGFFKLTGLYRHEVLIAAMHPDYPENRVYADPDSGEQVEIRLGAGHRIHGQVTDREGAPLEGVIIRICGSFTPIARHVITGPDGRYASPPLHPGRIFVRAFDAPEALGGPTGFVDECRAVDVLDRDVRVDFGALAQRVTWKGRFIGYDGKVTTGTLFISPSEYKFDEVMRFDMIRTISSGDDGRFVVDKPPAGPLQGGRRYSRAVPLRLECDRIRCAGVLERDIDLSAEAFLAGTLVDAVSGQPMEKTRGRIWARNIGAEQNSYVTDLRSDGTFRMRGVAPGSYRVTAEVENRPRKVMQGVRVEPGTRDRGVVIPMSRGGRLKLQITGFDDKGGDYFSLALSGGPSKRTDFYGYDRTGRGGERTKSYFLETGDWTASLAFRRKGYVERKFTVLPGKTTELTITDSDVTLRETPITLYGTVVYRTARR